MNIRTLIKVRFKLDVAYKLNEKLKAEKLDNVNLKCSSDSESALLVRHVHIHDI